MNVVSSWSLIKRPEAQLHRGVQRVAVLIGLPCASSEGHAETALQGGGPIDKLVVAYVVKEFALQGTVFRGLYHSALSLCQLNPGA
jgi:hypothetical protein